LHQGIWCIKWEIRNQLTVKKMESSVDEFGRYFSTASMNFARMTDSIWDSASVRR